jgi:phage anti-repressor protein
MKGVRSAIYYISLDTFEKICMVSKSEKANSVRDYFIILRKFINYYKDHISEMILARLKIIYLGWNPTIQTLLNHIF